MAGIVSIGWYVPSGRRTAAEVAQAYEISEDAVRSAGLSSHAVAGPEDHPSTLAAKATRLALDAASLAVDAIDLLIFVGMTRDYPPPWVGAFGVLKELGARRAAGFDILNRCPAVHDALWTAECLIRAGTFKTVVVCAGERFDYLYGPPRRPKQVSDTFYSTGGGAMVISGTAGNDLVAFSCYTGPDLSLQSQNIARAGGSRTPISQEALREGLQFAQNDMSVAQLAQLRTYLSDADRHNIRSVRDQAGFEEIDLLVCAPLDVKGQIESMRALGLDPEKALFVLPSLGHAGPTDSLISFGLALSSKGRGARRIVMSSRSLLYSNALAIRVRPDAPPIAVRGTPLGL